MTINENIILNIPSERSRAKQRPGETNTTEIAVDYVVAMNCLTKSIRVLCFVGYNRTYGDGAQLRHGIAKSELREVLFC
jgi:hypothetical protein